MREGEVCDALCKEAALQAVGVEGQQTQFVLGTVEEAADNSGRSQGGHPAQSLVGRVVAVQRPVLEAHPGGGEWNERDTRVQGRRSTHQQN